MTEQIFLLAAFQSNQEHLYVIYFHLEDGDETSVGLLSTDKAALHHNPEYNNRSTSPLCVYLMHITQMLHSFLSLFKSGLMNKRI